MQKPNGTHDAWCRATPPRPPPHPTPAARAFPAPFPPHHPSGCAPCSRACAPSRAGGGCCASATSPPSAASGRRCATRTSCPLCTRCSRASCRLAVVGWRLGSWVVVGSGGYLPLVPFCAHAAHGWVGPAGGCLAFGWLGGWVVERPGWAGPSCPSTSTSPPPQTPHRTATSPLHCALVPRRCTAGIPRAAHESKHLDIPPGMRGAMERECNPSQASACVCTCNRGLARVPCAVCAHVFV